MPTSAFCQVSDIAVTWEVLLEHDKFTEGYSQPTSELSTGSQIVVLEKEPKKLKGFAVS